MLWLVWIEGSNRIMQSKSVDCDAALLHLLSLTDGDQGVLEVRRIGQCMVPPLRARLFQRDPSGLLQPRCHVVDALTALNATDVLFEFLQTDRDIPDPIERAGEDAVINATARALRGAADEAVFRRLLLLAERRKLVGPIEVIGAMRRPEALPCLVAALEDDLARPVAEEGLRNFGAAAAPALKQAACQQEQYESESGRRRKRAALRLLSEIAPLPATSRDMRDHWRADPDPATALLGCQIALLQGDAAEREAGVRQLIAMLGEVDWTLRRDIEALLCRVQESKALHDALARAVQVEQEDMSRCALRQRSLLRVKERTHREDR